MVYLFLLPIALLLLYGTRLFFVNKPEFENQKSLIEYWFIFITIIFTLIAFQQASESIESSTKDFNNIIKRIDSITGNLTDAKKSLNEVDEKLSDLPSKIDSFSKSIKSLNNVVSSQKEQLSSTLTGFNKSILGFKESVDQMAERFNRKPNLNIDFVVNKKDSTFEITTIVINNVGTLTAEIYSVRVHVSNKGLLKFDLPGAKKDQTYDDYSTFEKFFQVPDYVFPNPQAAQTTGVIRCKIEFKKNINVLFDVFVYYRSAFGNDGVAYKTLIIP